ncbi:MAG: ATP-dependent DNA helicase [Bacteroidota bacterium]
MSKDKRAAQAAKFQEELARLNPAQRRAVDQIDGPVMVLAGPGTGKTHLLSARIGNILLQTDTPAASILCLTYTEAGVKAMRERLLGWIGAEAHRVAIHTFHGFCSLVIQDNLEHFGQRDLEPLADLERIGIIRELLDDLDIHHPLRRGRHSNYFYEKQLSSLYSAMKSENWTPAGITLAVDDYLSKLSEDPELVYQRKYKSFQKGDLKPAKVAKVRERMERLKAATQTFSDFQERLRKARRYDYDDMIGWVLQAFRDQPQLLRFYQERFLYVLVDEFQDTNGSQDEIVRLLADFWDRPNLFIVGDDDQAIYEFQGARLRSMVDFYRRYEEVTVIGLEENYRSQQQLLNQAAALIDENESRIIKRLPLPGIDKQLHAALKGEDVPPKIWKYSTFEQEIIGLVAQIKAWHAAGEAYGEMAVIYAKHQQGATLKKLLERAGVPYQSKRRPNVLDSLVVRQVMEILSYLDAENRQPGSAHHRLFRLLHFKCFGLAAYDLARLSLRYRQLEAKGTVNNWRELLEQAELWPADLRQPTGLVKVVNWLVSVQMAVVNEPLLRLLELVVNESGMLAQQLRDVERIERLQEVRTFLAFVEQELLRQPRLELSQLLLTLKSMDANRIELPLQRIFDQQDAVQLLTAHSAKGLEFNCVWLLDCVESKWGKGRQASNLRFPLPPTLTYSGEEDLIEARRRLFYVAMTRSKRSLIMSYADLDAAQKPISPVRFLQELLEGAEALEVVEQEVEQEELLAYLGTQVQLGPPSINPIIEKALIAEQLKDFRLSVSALHSFLDCPLAFFYERVLRVPTEQREAATYGDALHEALQHYFLRVKAEASLGWPSREELVFLFEQALQRRRSWFEPERYQQRLEQGRRELAAYYDKERPNWTDKVWVEQSIREVELEGVPLRGIIDRIDQLSDTQVAIWDYKTGAATDRKTKAPTPANPHGGSYWRQLVFYKLLFEGRSQEQRRVKQATLSYLSFSSNGEQKNIQVPITPKDEKTLSALIKASYERIQKQDFYTGCGKESCRWCQFVRDQELVVPPSSLEEEGLDDGG